MNPFQVYYLWQILIVIAVVACSCVTAARDTAGTKLIETPPISITQATVAVKYGTKIIPKLKDSDENNLAKNLVESTRNSSRGKPKNTTSSLPNRRSNATRESNSDNRNSKQGSLRTVSFRPLPVIENDIPIVYKTATTRTRTTSVPRTITTALPPTKSTAATVKHNSQTASSHNQNNNNNNRHRLHTASKNSNISRSNYTKSTQLPTVAAAVKVSLDSSQTEVSRNRSHHRNNNNNNNNNNNPSSRATNTISKANSNRVKATVTQLQPLEQQALLSTAFGARTNHLQTVKSPNGLNSESQAGKGLKPTTAITTTKAPFRSDFSLPNPFNVFLTQFWQRFSTPFNQNDVRRTTATPARKPPKKYQPITTSTLSNKAVATTKPNKSTERKVVSFFQTPPPTSSPAIISTSTGSYEAIKRSEGPFRIALPTSNRLSSNQIKLAVNNDTDKGKRDIDDNLRNKFNCPRESEVRFQLFPKICQIDDDCKVWNREEICCDIFGAKSCVSGIPKPLKETAHSRIIQRKCPNRPLAELWWELTECESDKDCWPRVCCPDGRKRYCRTSQPELNTVAIPVPVQRSYSYLSEYLRCTPPPPAIFDLHPKVCKSTLDCFPNVCCQEAGLRHCRPPQKSVLTMLANVLNVDFVKRLTQNLVIK